MIMIKNVMVMNKVSSARQIDSRQVVEWIESRDKWIRIRNEKWSERENGMEAF